MTAATPIVKIEVGFTGTRRTPNRLFCYDLNYDEFQHLPSHQSHSIARTKTKWVVRLSITTPHSPSIKKTERFLMQGKLRGLTNPLLPVMLREASTFYADDGFLAANWAVRMHDRATRWKVVRSEQLAYETASPRMKKIIVMRGFPQEKDKPYLSILYFPIGYIALLVDLNNLFTRVGLRPTPRYL